MFAMKSRILALLVLSCAANLAQAATPEVTEAVPTGMRGMPEVLAQWTAPSLSSSPLLASMLAGAGLVVGLARRRLQK
jgi:hypothetical protein